MNIAIFTNNYLPNPYGVTGSIESFRKQFEKKGYTVFIFAPNYKNYNDKNPNVFRYPAVDFRYKIKFPLVIPYSRKLSKKIEELNIDIIHSQHPNLLGSVALRLARKKNIPIVFTWHTLYDQYTNYVPLIPKKIVAKLVIEQAVKYANQVDQIIVPTLSIVKIIQEWGVKNKNIKAIATGIEEDVYKNTDREKIRRKYKIKKDETLLLLVSRLTEEKNIQFLMKAVIKILQANRRTKFMIAGKGYLEKELHKKVFESKLGDRIIFVGIIEKNRIKNYYSAGDIFVYASKSETQGMIISEAMYVGLPIVAIKASGVEDLVENNQNGFLVSENEKEFVVATEKLIKNKELREKFSKKSTEIAREKYTSKICADKMLRVYQDVIKNFNNK